MSEIPSDMELNPFNPDVPDSIRNLSPDLYQYLRQLAEIQREQHNKNQAGDTTFVWQVLLAQDDEPRYKVGSEGKFFHPTFGVMIGRYVRFAHMRTDLSPGPVAILRQREFSWTVTNDIAQALPDSVAGVLCDTSIPTREYGWILLRGSNLQPMQIHGTAPNAFDTIGWEQDGFMHVASKTTIDFARILDVSQITSIGGAWSIPAASLLIDIAPANANAQTKAVDTADIVIPPDPKVEELDSEVKRLYREMMSSDGRSWLAVEMIQSRLVVLNDNEASITLTETLNAMANFANLAGQATELARDIGKDVMTALKATNEFYRQAKVYRTEAGYYATSTTRFYNMASVEAAKANESAVASSTFEQSAMAWRDEAGVHAQSALTFSGNAAASAGAAETQAGYAEGWSSTASGHSADAKHYSELAAQYYDDVTGVVAAAITAEREVRVEAEGVIAKSVEDFYTEYGEYKTSISETFETYNGIFGKWSIAIDNNGTIVGIELINGTDQKDLTLQADRLKVKTATGSKTPFEVTGDQVKFGADLYIGNYRIIADTGTVMQVQGLGFGSSNQFIEWFGPSMAISAMNESNAISYKKLDGSAYFGGALNAGVITNAQRTTSLSPTASVTTGAFGSNGGDRVVTVSVAASKGFADDAQNMGSCPSSPITPSITVELYRGADTGGAFLHSATFYGSFDCEAAMGPGEPGYMMENVQGSFTFTDSSGGLSASYYARITSRSMNTSPSLQSLGVISVEQ